MLGWLKEWDKCVYKRVNPLQSKKRARETEELGAGGYVSLALNARVGSHRHIVLIIFASRLCRAMHLDVQRREYVAIAREADLRTYHALHLFRYCFCLVRLVWVRPHWRMLWQNKLGTMCSRSMQGMAFSHHGRNS